jgi:hypothetical protein
MLLKYDIINIWIIILHSFKQIAGSDNGPLPHKNSIMFYYLFILLFIINQHIIIIIHIVSN